MSRPAHISPGVSITAALLCLWLFGNLGFTVMQRLGGPWLMPPTDDTTLLIMMLGGFYGARVASQFIAVYLASVIMAHSRVARPYHVLTTVVAGYYFVGMGIRWTLKRPGFESVGDSAPTLGFLFEVLSVAALAGASLLFLYSYRAFSRPRHSIATHG
jgi:hypothetical protein